MLVAGLGMALVLLILPARLWQAGKEREDAHPSRVALALALAVALSIAVRGWNSGAGPLDSNLVSWLDCFAGDCRHSPGGFLGQE